MIKLLIDRATCWIDRHWKCLKCRICVHSFEVGEVYSVRCEGIYTGIMEIFCTKCNMHYSLRLPIDEIPFVQVNDLFKYRIRNSADERRKNDL